MGYQRTLFRSHPTCWQSKCPRSRSGSSTNPASCIQLSDLHTSSGAVEHSCSSCTSFLGTAVSWMVLDSSAPKVTSSQKIALPLTSATRKGGWRKTSNQCLRREHHRLNFQTAAVHYLEEVSRLTSSLGVLSSAQVLNMTQSPYGFQHPTSSQTPVSSCHIKVLKLDSCSRVQQVTSPEALRLAGLLASPTSLALDSSLEP